MRLYHFLESKWALDDLQKGRLKIALLDDMNDPFELLACDMREQRARREFEIFRDAVCKISGALCFCSTWHNPLMWSHYAERHRGVALAFEIDARRATPMQYRPERLADLIPKLIRGSEADRHEASNLLFATKYKHWQYESEHRLFTERKDEEAEDGRHFFDFEPHLKLKAVLLGVRFANSERAAFEKALRPKYQGVEIIQTRMAFKSYRIVRQKLKSPWIA